MCLPPLARLSQTCAAPFTASHWSAGILSRPSSPPSRLMNSSIVIIFNRFLNSGVSRGKKSAKPLCLDFVSFYSHKNMSSYMSHSHSRTARSHSNNTLAVTHRQQVKRCFWRQNKRPTGRRCNYKNDFHRHTNVVPTASVWSK